MTAPNFPEAAREGDAVRLHSDLREKALSSLYFFTKVILGYKELADLHIEFCREIQENSIHRKHGYLMPRGHFKSTIVSKAYPLWRLCHDRETRILVVGESDTVAKKNMKDIQWHIQNNQLFRWLFPELIPPDISKTKWTENEVLLPREHSYDESSITMIGVGSKTTGFHYDLIVYDDMIGEKAAKSEAEMESAITWFQYAPGLLNNPAFGEEILIGTRWKHGEADLYGYIMAQLPAEVSSTGRARGFRWYVRKALEDNYPIFPERFNLDVLEEIRKREGDYKFSCQYMNDPIAPGATDFDGGKLKEYIVAQDNQTILPSDNTGAIKLGQLLRMSFYDISAGGPEAKAKNAIVGAGMSADRRIFVFFGWNRNCSIGDACEEWFHMQDHFRCYRNHYEQVGSQKAVEDVIRERNNEQYCKRCQEKDGKTIRKHRRIEPIPIKPPGGMMNKEDRIRDFAQTAINEGRVYLRRGMQELRQQIISFPHGKLVDMVDALAYVINLLRPPLSDEELAEEREAGDTSSTPPPSRTHTSRNYGGYV